MLRHGAVPCRGRALLARRRDLSGPRHHQTAHETQLAVTSHGRRVYDGVPAYRIDDYARYGPAVPCRQKFLENPLVVIDQERHRE